MHPPLLEQVDEVDLPLPVIFGVRVMWLSPLLPMREPSLISIHPASMLLWVGMLVWEPSFVQVAPTPEPLKETVLPDVVPRSLLDELRHFPDGDTGFGDLDGLGEDDLGLHFLHPLLQREALLLFKKPLLFLCPPTPAPPPAGFLKFGSARAP